MPLASRATPLTRGVAPSTAARDDGSGVRQTASASVATATYALAEAEAHAALAAYATAAAQAVSHTAYTAESLATQATPALPSARWSSSLRQTSICPPLRSGFERLWHATAAASAQAASVALAMAAQVSAASTAHAALAAYATAASQAALLAAYAAASLAAQAASHIRLARWSSSLSQTSSSPPLCSGLGTSTSSPYLFGVGRCSRPLSTAHCRNASLALGARLSCSHVLFGGLRPFPSLLLPTVLGCLAPLALVAAPLTREAAASTAARNGVTSAQAASATLATAAQAASAAAAHAALAAYSTAALQAASLTASRRARALTYEFRIAILWCWRV